MSGVSEILLINTNRETGPLPVLPLGLCQLASAVAQAGLPVEVLDLCFPRKPLEQVRKVAARVRPRLVGVTIRNVDNCDFQAPIYYLPFVRDVIEAVRQVLPGVPVVIGGTGTSLAPQEVLEEVGADLAVAGPGDRVFVELYRHLVEDGERVEDQPRIQYGRPDDGESTPGPQFARWLDLKPYRRWGVPISVQSRRGCPFRCVYCEYAHIEGGAPYLLRDVDEVVEGIERLVRSTGRDVVEFVDSTFNAPPSYTIELCEALARRRPAKAFHASGINPRFGGREVLEAMRDAGVTAVYCSPDAGAQGTIDGYRKDFSLDQLADMARDTSALGFPVLWSFIFAGPAETPETARETKRFVREQIDPLHAVMLSHRMRIYPGTGLRELADEEGYPPFALDLREPGQFYLSSAIEQAEIDALLAEAATTIGNVMSMAASQAVMARLVQRIIGLSGWTKPNWKNYPKMRYWMKRFRVPWT